MVHGAPVFHKVQLPTSLSSYMEVRIVGIWDPWCCHIQRLMRWNKFLASPEGPRAEFLPRFGTDFLRSAGSGVAQDGSESSSNPQGTKEASLPQHGWCRRDVHTARVVSHMAGIAGGLLRALDAAGPMEDPMYGPMDGPCFQRCAHPEQPSQPVEDSKRPERGEQKS